MAASKHEFQGYNFPFSGQENVSQSFVDYGSPSMLNIHLEEHGKKLVIHSKQSHDSQSQRLVANQVSLPFLEPNQRSSTVPEETLNDYQLSGHLCRDRISFEKANVHVDNFSTDHPEIMYSTISDLVQNDLNCLPWDTCDTLKSNSFLPWKGKETRCKLCYSFRRAYNNQKSNPARVMTHLASALWDISPVLLYDLFQESHALEAPRFHYDTFLGNCLSCHSLETGHQGLLMYPSGPGLDVLNFSHISEYSGFMEFEGTESNSTPFKPVLSNQQFAVHGQIRQIDMATYSQSNIIVGVRSQYNCSFFQSNTTARREGLSMKPLETVAVSKQAMCIAVSPHIPGEAVTVTEMGGVYLWSSDHSLRTVHQAVHADNQDSPWYQCVFAANPRCIAMADAKGINLLDFRAPTLFQKLFFSIPSTQVDSFECVSAIQRHPQNTHHYVLATDQSLMLLDDRFLHHPVLKWRHHNEDPVQFINVTCDAIQGCDDTVLVISGSNHRQTHCFQYSDSQSQAEGVLPLVKKECYLPPQSTSLPWKVASYNEWYYAGLRNDLTFSPATASRLSQPLIGVCTLLHTSHPQKGFTVFQMSSVGDLFHQPFVVHDDKDSEEGCLSNNECGTMMSSELGPRAKILCQKWIDLADLQNDNFVKTAPCQVQCVELDKTGLCDELTLLLEPHPCCVLCNSKQTLETTAPDQAESQSNVCKRCGVELTYSTNLVKNQQNKGILTRESLGIQYQVKDIGIFLDMTKATDPLSKSLWLNWTSSEPIPVFSSVEQEPENKDIEKRTEKEGMKTSHLVATASNSIDPTPPTSVSDIHLTVQNSSLQKQSTPSSPQLQQPVQNQSKLKRKETRFVMGF